MKISAISEKLHNFEDTIKQKSILLYFVYYLITTALKYVTVIALTTVIALFIAFIALELEPKGISLLFWLIAVIVTWLNPAIIYVFLFSRNKLSIHPFIISYLFNIYTFHQSDLSQYILVFFLSLLGAAIVVYVQWLFLIEKRI